MILRRKMELKLKINFLSIKSTIKFNESYKNLITHHLNYFIEKVDRIVTKHPPDQALADACIDLHLS